MLVGAVVTPPLFPFDVGAGEGSGSPLIHHFCTPSITVQTKVLPLNVLTVS